MSKTIRQSHLGRKQAEGKGGKGKRVHEESEPHARFPAAGGGGGFGGRRLQARVNIKRCVD